MSRPRLSPPSTRLAVVAVLLWALGGSLGSQMPQAVLSPWLETALRQGRADERHRVWVYFRDKGMTAARVDSEAAIGSPRARARRAARGSTAPMLTEDLPLDRGYVHEVATRAERVRQQSRWLNAVSVVTNGSLANASTCAPVARHPSGVGDRGCGPRGGCGHPGPHAAAP
jgi:hypothetical protein